MAAPVAQAPTGPTSNADERTPEPASSCVPVTVTPPSMKLGAPAMGATATVAFGASVSTVACSVPP